MKRPIPIGLRRGKDDRTDKERCRRRVQALCPVCAIFGLKKLGRRGWANGFCIFHAKCDGHIEPRKSRNRNHHKDEMPSERKRNGAREPKEKKPKVMVARWKNSKPIAKALQCTRNADDLEADLEDVDFYEDTDADGQAFEDQDGNYDHVCYGPRPE